MAIVLLSAAIVVLLVLIALLIRRDKARSENGVIEAVDETIPDEVITGDEDGEEMPPPEEVKELKAEVLFATVWPTKYLEVFSDTEKSGVIGVAELGEALCVLEEKDDMFRVRVEAGEGYIDSNYCMINLSEYLGEICLYDITNSYDSIYLVHDYAIPEVSGTVIPGYENVLLNDGTFLVPLLYPVAKKFAPVALKVRDDGYAFKIYDSYRPHKATRYIYDKTSEILYFPLPKETFTRITPTQYLLDGDRNLWEDWDAEAVMQEALALYAEGAEGAEGATNGSAEDSVMNAQEPLPADAPVVDNAAPAFAEGAVDPASANGAEEAPAGMQKTPSDEAPLITDTEGEAAGALTQADPEAMAALRAQVEEALATGVLSGELIAMLPEGTVIYDEATGLYATHVQAWLELMMQITEPPKPQIPYELTYHHLMTGGGGYHLGSFLAAVGSTHNYGIAMDLTLVRLSDGKELQAQTAMHDLSHHSAMSHNTQDADIIKDYLVPAGFGTIGSEWWHFQDNETRAALRPIALSDGLSIEGWKMDENGWRYRNADGSYRE